ncbi:hypothetical protein, partial [Escherichia coli]|uniref:hypothetical protein n=1 Tax=Escherichia coli TaxID=562 RepID=UPI002000DBE4
HPSNQSRNHSSKYFFLSSSDGKTKNSVPAGINTESLIHFIYPHHFHLRKSFKDSRPPLFSGIEFTIRLMAALCWGVFY